MRTTPTDPWAPTRDGRGFRSRSPRGSEGYMLIEALISAFLVALVVISSMTGFQAASRATAEERHHSVAAQLAAESQERLRSDPASVLNTLYGEPRSYTQSLGGTTYTVEQKVEPLNSTGTLAACSATEKSSQTGSNVSVESAVTWPSTDSARKTAGVRERGIITPPVGSAVEVDVLNGQEPEAGVPNANSVIYYPASSPTGTLEASTGGGGCTVFTGLPVTSAKVEVPEKLAFVVPSGALKYGPKEVAVAPNITTHTQVLFNEGGQIKGEYTYKGATSYQGEPVTGETFTASNVRMDAEPNFILGAAGAIPFEYEAGGERRYKALTGVGHSATSALTPAGTSYPKGDLFPFPSAWLVSAGDCKANNVTSEDQASPAPVVHPGQATSVAIPTSYLRVNVWKGTKLVPIGLDPQALPVMITDTACSSEPTPDNAFATNLKHPQEAKNGHLEHPFQPFGKAQLCVRVPVIGTNLLPRRYTVNYTLGNANGLTLNLYETELLSAKTKTLEREEEVENEAKEKSVVKLVIEELEALLATCK
jgi:Tfp pilus assembly protein PilX